MSLHPVSQLIRTRVKQTEEMEHSSPLFLTSSFCFDNAEEMRAAFADENDDNIYSRFSNPTVQELSGTKYWTAQRQCQMTRSCVHQP